MTSAVRAIGSSSILGLATTAAATADQDLGDEEEGTKVRHVDGCEWEYLSVNVYARESSV